MPNEAPNVPKRGAPELIRAFGSFELDTRAIDDDKRSIDWVVSSEAEDAHGTIVEQTWDLSRYKRNPVVLWNHNTEGPGYFGGGKPGDSIPIARAEKVRIEEGKLKVRIVFPIEGEDELSDRVWKAIKSKRINMTSVGFKPGKVTREERPDGSFRYRLSDNILFEISITPIGSCPDAIAERSLLARYVDDPTLLDSRHDGEREPRNSNAAPAADDSTRSASMECTMNFLTLLAKKLGCTADEVSIIEALDKVKAERSIGAELITGEAVDFEKQIRTLQTEVETARRDLETARTEATPLRARATLAIVALTALGLTETAGEAEVTKSIAGLQGRAAKADELEPKVANLEKDLATLGEEQAVREIDFLIKRGKDYEFSYDERSRKALLAYRKADPKGFAEDHKAALDGLRAFDDPKLFQKVTAPGGAAGSDVDATVTRAANQQDEFETRLAAYRKKHPELLESEAIDAVLREKDRA